MDTIPKNKRFTFEFDVYAVPHNDITEQLIYGNGEIDPDFTGNPDIPEEAHARDILFTFFQDAIIHALSCKMHWDNENEQHMVDYHQRKFDNIEAVKKTVKLARVEDVDRGETNTPKELQNKKFVFEVTVDDIPHNADTVEHAFGEGAWYNSDFPEHTHASEELHMMVQETLIYYLDKQLKCAVKEDEAEGKFYRKKENVARGIQASIKFVKSEDIP